MFRLFYQASDTFAIPAGFEGTGVFTIQLKKDENVRQS